MIAAAHSTDALKLDGFVRHYRSMAVVWAGTVLALTAILATIVPLTTALAFGALHFSLYATELWAAEVAARDRDASRALHRLTWRTGLLVFLLSLHACWMAFVVLDHATTLTGRIEAGLLLIGVLVFTALQLHMSMIGYLVAMASPVIAMLMLGFGGRLAIASGQFGTAICIFVVAILAASWRQQASDRTLWRARLALVEKNADLLAMVAEAEAARGQAEAANRAKSDFLAVTSHEIRTPLNAVLGLTEALNRSRLSRKQKAMAEGVLDAGALLKRLLDAVLDITRIEAGRMTLEAAPFDLRRMAQTVVQVWSPRAAEQGVSLALDIEALPTPCGLKADGGKVEQALVNLLSNAIKFSPRGGVVTVRLSATGQGDDLAVRIEVLDQGAGVPVEDRDRIFQTFEQTREGRILGGAGLGLAICAGNLALMGGTIGVGEAPGGGAAFHFAFNAPVAGVLTVATQTEAAPALDDDRPLRVLAAEDNAANRHVLRVLLEPLSVDLTLVVNGHDAVEAMASGAFDMVLMDANMPIMDGLTALRAIRAGDGPAATTPVWMLTANVFEDDVTRYRAAGADGVIRKPIDLPELFAALSEAAARVAMPAAAVAA
ncbi:MAG: response regulator [Caulobacter sp.]|nr:response regulator [Caulobacter sp.]